MPIEANNEGVAEGYLVVPEGIPAGTVQVTAEGNQGSRGTATYTSSGTITTEQRRQVTTVYRNYDSLSQTFTLEEGRHIAGVDLWFRAKGASRVIVQIRETTVGFPNKNVIAQASLMPGQINVNGTETRVLFRPIWLEANTEYALVILTDDPTAALAVCELGKYDSIHGTYVTKQAYQAGVLLSSSNASTWTAHQDIDLAFRLLACRFTETNYEINLGTATANNNTDIVVRGNVERVATGTDVEFSLTDTGGRTNTLTEDMPVSLKETLNGDLSFKVKLKGTRTQSPVLYQGVQLLLGTQDATADYVTRSIPAGTNTTVRIVFEAYTPGNSNVKVYYQQLDTSWSLIPLTEGAPIGNGVEERTHVLENYNQSTVKIKLTLEGSALYRPFVKNLRVTTT